MSFSKIEPNEDLEYAIQSDTDANDSDKLLTPPVRELWQVIHIWVELTTTATVGDRQLEITLRDGSDDIVWQIAAGLVQAASLTYNYLFAPGLANMTAVVDGDKVTTAIPAATIVPGGFDLRVWDNNAVDAAADDMIVHMAIAKTNS